VRRRAPAAGREMKSEGRDGIFEVSQVILNLICLYW
jgi:hypothetical protein